MTMPETPTPEVPADGTATDTAPLPDPLPPPVEPNPPEDAGSATVPTPDPVPPPVVLNDDLAPPPPEMLPAADAVPPAIAEQDLINDMRTAAYQSAEATLNALPVNERGNVRDAIELEVKRAITRFAIIFTRDGMPVRLNADRWMPHGKLVELDMVEIEQLQSEIDKSNCDGLIAPVGWDPKTAMP